VLKQDMEWYDTHTSADFASKMAEDLNHLQVMLGTIGTIRFFDKCFSIFFQSIASDRPKRMGVLRPEI
jgi:hypothetical protein